LLDRTEELASFERAEVINQVISAAVVIAESPAVANGTNVLKWFSFFDKLLTIPEVQTEENAQVSWTEFETNMLDAKKLVVKGINVFFKHAIFFAKYKNSVSRKTSMQFMNKI